MTRVHALVLACCLMACADYSLMRAETAYNQKRYLEVAEELAQREAEAVDLPVEDRARFGALYGLSLLRLGDPERAERWLQMAREAGEANLSPALRKELAAGWAELEQVTRP